MTTKRGGSIWDHPEEMISNHHNNTTSTVKDNMRDGNNSIYSEFDNDGSSYNNKQQHHQQQRGRTTNSTNTRSRGGGGSIESRYDIEKEMMMGNHAHTPQQKKEIEGEGDGEEGMDAILNKPNMKTALGVGAAATLGGEFPIFKVVSFSCV